MICNHSKKNGGETPVESKNVWISVHDLFWMSAALGYAFF